MAVIRRCDSCHNEVPVKMGFVMEDQWWHVYQTAGESMAFCSEGCLADYYLAKRMIDGAM